MPPEELFKLLQVAIVVEHPDKVPLALCLPTRKELRDGVPLLEKGLALLFRFQRRCRLRTVAVNPQLSYAPVLACTVQRPANFAICSRGGRASIRHPQGRDQQAAKARPKDTNH